MLQSLRKSRHKLRQSCAWRFFYLVVEIDIKKLSVVALLYLLLYLQLNFYFSFQPYLIFVTDTTDGVCVKKIARCKFLQI